MTIPDQFLVGGFAVLFGLIGFMLKEGLSLLKDIIKRLTMLETDSAAVREWRNNLSERLGIAPPIDRRSVPRY